MADLKVSGVKALNWTAISFAVLQSICALALALGTAGALFGISLFAIFSGLMRLTSRSGSTPSPFQA